MNALTETARLLRETATRIDEMTPLAFDPMSGGIDIHAAIERLATVLGRTSFSIKMELDVFSYSHQVGKADASVKWSVWDGRKFHADAKSLADAVNLVILSVSPQPTDPVLAVSQTLDPLPL